MPLIIFANKYDLEDERQITEEQLSQLAEKHGAQWFYSSAKTGENVEAGFEALAKILIK